MEINVQFHLFQEMTNQFTVVIVSDNTNQMIQEMIDVQEMIDIQETIEVQEIQEMTDIQNIQETIEVQEIMIEKIPR